MHTKRVTIKKLQKSHDENVAASAAEKRSLKSNIFSQKLGVGLKDAEPGSASFKPTFVAEEEKLDLSERFSAAEAATFRPRILANFFHEMNPRNP